MRFIFLSTPTFEPWDWTNPEEKGIGGSETHHIEMSKRLARRGHEVLSYAPVPWSDGHREHEGVTWKHSDKTDWSLPGIWVVARDVAILDKFAGDRKDQEIWFIAQDSFYTNWTDERIAKCNRIVALCEAEKLAMLSKNPAMAGKLCVSSNGISTDRIDKQEKEETQDERNPRRLIYTSSPDRGLLQLLKIFRRAREYVSDLELHAYYGFNNIEKILESTPVKAWRENKEAIEALLRQPGVHWHGRTPQPELWREWRRSGLWAYPANFTETSCISCMEAQALGAIPICNPIWAVGENVRHGVFIDGDVNEPMTQARYAGEIVRLASQPKLQEEIRGPMMPWARKQFDWERIVDQFEGWEREDATLR